MDVGCRVIQVTFTVEAGCSPDTEEKIIAIQVETYETLSRTMQYFVIRNIASGLDIKMANLVKIQVVDFTGAFVSLARSG